MFILDTEFDNRYRYLVRPENAMAKRKTDVHRKYIWLGGYKLSNVLRAAFSGDGAVIIQLVGIGVGSWIATSVLSAIGKGQLGRFVQIISVFLAIGLALNAVGKVLNRIF